MMCSLTPTFWWHMATPGREPFWLAPAGQARYAATPAPSELTYEIISEETAGSFKATLNGDACASGAAVAARGMMLWAIAAAVAAAAPNSVARRTNSRRL